MVTDKVPTVGVDATMREAIVCIAELRGLAIVVDRARRVLGVLTGGDLTRLMERVENIMSVPVVEVMNRNPKLALRDELASAVVYRMERHGIMSMPVVDHDDQLVGVVHLHDLMRARVV
jgi:arabinose-5-phosphate isomerase